MPGATMAVNSRKPPTQMPDAYDLARTAAEGIEACMATVVRFIDWTEYIEQQLAAPDRDEVNIASARAFALVMHAIAKREFAALSNLAAVFQVVCEPTTGLPS